MAPPIEECVHRLACSPAAGCCCVFIVPVVREIERKMVREGGGGGGGSAGEEPARGRPEEGEERQSGFSMDWASICYDLYHESGIESKPSP